VFSAVAAFGTAVLLVLPGTAVAAAAPPAAPASAVFVELDGPSALQRYTALLGQGRDVARRAARDARGQIAAATDALLARFHGSEASTEIFRTSNAVPGVALRVTPSIARELAHRPGVRSVRRITPARPTNASADQLGRAVQAWQQTGRLGTGIRIGVIDTGIDYTHADLGGPGTSAAYDAIDPVRAARPGSRRPR
jgi:subtilisin family serine protease